MIRDIHVRREGGFKARAFVAAGDGREGGRGTGRGDKGVMKVRVFCLRPSLEFWLFLGSLKVKIEESCKCKFKIFFGNLGIDYKERWH